MEWTTGQREPAGWTTHKLNTRSRSICRTPAAIASIQKLPTWDFQLVEGETAALRHKDDMSKVVRILTQTLPVIGKNRVKEVFDLHLVTPDKGMTIDSLKVADNGKALPLFTGKEADQFRYPRLAPQGLFAAKGNQLVFFASTTLVFAAKTEQPRNVLTFSEQIDYLNRVHLGQQSIVATTAKGMTYVLNVEDVIRANQQAKVSAQAELGARFVGTPGGNGLEYSLEIGTQGKDQVLHIWPKASKHAQQIVSAACDRQTVSDRQRFPHRGLIRAPSTRLAGGAHSCARPITTRLSF